MAGIRYTALFYSLCLLVTWIQAKDVNYCDKKADYDVKISGIEITPYPMARGKTANFSIAVSTDNDKSISGGKLVIEVAYFGWYIHSESHDLCEETSCPANGDFVISHAQVLPGLTPPGSYTLKMTMTDGNKHQLTCINFDFSIGWLAASEAIADS